MIEHKVISTHHTISEDLLNELAANGWEFIQSVAARDCEIDAPGFVHYFKREKPND